MDEPYYPRAEHKGPKRKLEEEEKGGRKRAKSEKREIGEG